MLQIINNVLNDEVLAEFTQLLSVANFTSGTRTAGKIAKKVKNNLELNPDFPQKSLLTNAIMGAIMTSDEFQQGAMPLKMSTPIFAKYLKGMSYGYHVDNPIMGQGNKQYRSDVSLTLFLNNPDDYEGGELTIQTTFGLKSIKLPAGSMVVYPSSSLHCVAPVTKGERLVMITWIQSKIKNPAQREILFNLWQVKNNLSSKDTNNNFNLLDISYANLVRMWSNL